MKHMHTFGYDWAGLSWPWFHDDYYPHMMDVQEETWWNATQPDGGHDYRDGEAATETIF